MSLQYVIFIVTNWLSYTLWFTAISITSLLCYWHIISNFCHTWGTNSLQKCIYEKWGDIVTQYIIVLVCHSSLIQQTHEKVVFCNTRSVSEIVNIWWWRSSDILTLSSHSVRLKFHHFLSKYIWVLVIYSWFNTYENFWKVCVGLMNIILVWYNK